MITTSLERMQYRTLELPAPQRGAVEQALAGGRAVALEVRAEVWGMDEQGRALLCFVDPQGRMGRLGTARLSPGRRAEILVAQEAGCQAELVLQLEVMGRCGCGYGVTVCDPEGELVLRPRSPEPPPWEAPTGEVQPSGAAGA